jgi:hypothetical protein
MVIFNSYFDITRGYFCGYCQAVQHMPAPMTEKSPVLAPKRKPKKEEKDMAIPGKLGH